ncbi:uncharacterized protein LOC136084618 isoform X2 [Hydra vulgaris]|uniref:Uncharacterized protein LOC136084618 isoform X2 n=1 Tax=Hydra vulgaris TaxID=6087 RepID=A0ABM4CH09_HYDVU
MFIFAAIFCNLVILLSLVSSENEVSKVFSQTKILNACKNICRCKTDAFIKNDEDRHITWSKIYIHCTTFNNLHKIFLDRKQMIYNEDSNEYDEPVEYNEALPPEIQDISDNIYNGYKSSKNEKKTFEIIEVEIDEVSKASFETKMNQYDEYYYLKYITKLTFRGTSCLNRISGEKFLQYLPNLYMLSIKSSAETLDIELVDLSNLLDFRIEVGNAVNLYCAFENEMCLSNPKGLSNFEIYFNNIQDFTKTGLNIYGKMELPKKIEDFLLSYDKSSERVTPCSTLQTNTEIKLEKKKKLFENIEFQKFHFIMPYEKEYRNEFKNVLLQAKDTIADINVLNEIHIEGERTIVESLLIKVYELGLQNKLVLQLNNFDSNFDIPILYAPQTSFDESQFEKCNYGEKILKNSDMNVYVDNVENIAVIRGFHLKLSQLFDLKEHFQNSKDIRVYTYNIDIDTEPYESFYNIFKEKLYKDGGIKFIVYYVNIGSTKQEKINGFYPGDDTPFRGSFHYRKYFQLQFISMKNFDEPDPIFTRAITTCLIMNVGVYHKRAPNSLLLDNKMLSTWYNIIKNSLKYNDTLYNSLEISRSQSAFKYLQSYITMSDNMNAQMTRVPLLSIQILSQNIQILAQAGRDIRDKSKHLNTLKTLNSQSQQTLQAIGDSKISILKASMKKSISLGEIEKRKQKDIEKQWNQTQQLIDYLTKEFETFKTEVETESVTFKNGVILATSLAVAEAAAEAVNCIIGIFSGGFNPAKALNAARKIFTKLGSIIPKVIKVMRAIKSLIDKRKLLGTTFKKVKEAWKNMGPKLTSFFQSQKNVLLEWWNKKKNDKDLVNKYSDKITEFFKKEGTAESTKEIVENTISLTKAIRTVKIGYDPGQPLTGIHDGFNYSRFTTIKEAVEKFKHPGVNETINLGQNLSSVDVFKWTIAKEHVTGMMDTTLSDDVPEATNYRTALLKLITTGETRTQAALDQAVLETSFSASCFAWELYTEEGISIGNEIEKTKENLKGDKPSGETLSNEIKKLNSSLHLDIEWEQLAIKLELVHLNEEYCNAYYYFHLEKCEDDLRINPSDDLEKILSIQNILLYQSNSKLQNLFPPPQTFTDLSITIEQPKYCKCFEIFKTKKDSAEINVITITNDDINYRKRAVEEMYESVKECLIPHLDYKKLKENTILTKKHIDNEDLEKLKERKIANDLLDNCINNPIENVKKNKQFVYKVDIDSSYFIGHERVRIDEVKVIFKGAKTTNGIVKIYAESTGISEDRYKDQCYKFIGDRWIRLLSYYSKSSISNEANTDVTQKKDIAPNLVKLLERELYDQVTFIDTANIHKKFEGLFTSPTVFTTWSFIIPEKINPGLNLEELKEIELKFSGSFITTDYNKEITQCKVKDKEEIEATAETQQKKKIKKKIKKRKTKENIQQKKYI